MTIIDYETRAKTRRLENKALKKKIKELTTSRDGWKLKFMEQKKEFDVMKKKVESVKKNIQNIIKI